MRLSLFLAVLCLAGAASARSVHDLERELLQLIREMADDSAPGEEKVQEPVVTTEEEPGDMDYPPEEEEIPQDTTDLGLPGEESVQEPVVTTEEEGDEPGDMDYPPEEEDTPPDTMGELTGESVQEPVVTTEEEPGDMDYPPEEEDTPPDTMGELAGESVQEPVGTTEEEQEPGDMDYPPEGEDTPPDTMGELAGESVQEPVVTTEEEGDEPGDMDYPPEEEETPQDAMDEAMPAEESVQEPVVTTEEEEVPPVKSDDEALLEVLESLLQKIPEKEEDDNMATTQEEEGAPDAMEPVDALMESGIIQVKGFAMKVTFNGEEFTQRISFDDAAGSETIKVSAHGDMGEVNIRHCFNQGMTLECFPDNNKCYLLSIASEGEPGLQQQEEDMKKCQKESPSGEVKADDLEEKTNNWVVKEQVPREELPGCLADFQPDWAVYAAGRAPDDEGAVTDDVADAQEGKRYVHGGSQQCAGGASTVEKLVLRRGSCRYGCDGRRVCDYFNTQCVCCPEVTDASKCLVCRG